VPLVSSATTATFLDRAANQNFVAPSGGHRRTYLGNYSQHLGAEQLGGRQPVGLLTATEGAGQPSRPYIEPIPAQCHRSTQARPRETAGESGPSRPRWRALSGPKFRFPDAPAPGAR